MARYKKKKKNSKLPFKKTSKIKYLKKNFKQKPSKVFIKQIKRISCIFYLKKRKKGKLKKNTKSSAMHFCNTQF